MIIAVKAETKFKETKKKESKLEIDLSATTVNWTPPSQGFYKVNWDATLCWENSKIGIGIIVKDYRGHVIATKKTNVSFAQNSHTAESFGTYQAVQFALDISIRKIILGGDALNVINHNNQSGDSCYYLRAIIWDIKNVLTQLDLWKMIHIRKGSNIVADALAKSALSISEDVVELESCPSCIVSLI